VGGLGYLRRCAQTSFILHALKPLQSFLAYALETTGAGTRLPDTGAEEIDLIKFGEVFGALHYLAFGFGAARTGDYQAAARGWGYYLLYVHFHCWWLYT
jgi:hypothetical protein